MIKKSVVIDIIFIVLLSTICHLLFSPYGFNPTDEGFVLSSTNRVLHGQIPHVDFSSLRPLGYAYLHIPELLFSKTHFFLISRFVYWLQHILIAFLWIRLMQRTLKVEIISSVKYLLIFITFVFNVHYFPCSVLHTIDGLLMCLIGFNLIRSEHKTRFFGFIFIGLAALCKQNYLVILPISIVLYGRENKIIATLIGLLPISMYLFFITLNDGLKDLLIQLSGHSELLQVGVWSYILNPVFILVVFLTLLLRHLKIGLINSTVLFLFSIILLVTEHYHGKYSFLVIAYLIAECMIAILDHYKIFFDDKQNSSIQESTLITANASNLSQIFIYDTPFFKLASIVIALSWCVSISVGYNTPALFSGAGLSFIYFHNNRSKFTIIHTTNKKQKNYMILSGAIFLIVFLYVRYTITYRDATIHHLDKRLDQLVEGAHGIYTNKNTYAVLKELDSLKRTYPKSTVIPDFTACSILHSHQSNILTEWPNKTEIPNQKVLQKITSKINLKTHLIWIVPKYQTALLKDGFTSIPNSGADYPIINYLLTHQPARRETNYFYIYEHITPPINENNFRSTP